MIVLDGCSMQQHNGFLPHCADIIKCLPDPHHEHNPDQLVVNEALRLKWTLVTPHEGYAKYRLNLMNCPN